MTGLTTRDRLLLAQMPLVGVPPESPLERLQRNGQRLVMAANGQFLEIRRDWIYALRRCGAAHSMLQVPFGAVREITELSGGPIPRRLVCEFLRVAREVCPMEVGGIITFDTASGDWALHINRSISASPVHLRYELPELRTTEHRVVDIHSHGDGDAFLSMDDRHDMRGTTAVVMVAGRVDSATPQVIAFLCLHGMPIAIPWTDQDDLDIAAAECANDDDCYKKWTFGER
ncbi:MAG: PRTRC system protein A [Thermomicrobiales bacterium]|nr:MAG: PRTRC system protein A [Thermomicrobiales bacterium]